MFSIKYLVRYTKGAHEDLLRLFQFLVQYDTETAYEARNAIEKSTELLQLFPFTCRKVDLDNPFLRELLIPFGTSGYVALFEKVLFSKVFVNLPLIPGGILQATASCCGVKEPFW